ncbi:MAG: hypothetical protein AB7T06_28565 [Kofleriaceae bacterium]
MLMLGASTAIADDELEGTPQSTAAPTAPSQLPPPQSDNDPAPPVASPGVDLPPGNVVQQAGIGGQVGYGRAGVLELGGSAGLMLSSNFRNITVAPQIGWFVADNLELSAIVQMSNIKAGDEDGTMWSAVVEPSYHVPFNRTMFGFLGMGVGAAYEQRLGAGLAVAPRIGANFLVGRSGILTPSLQYQYITHNQMTEDDVTVVALTNALTVNVGYTAMW